jgi:hypothetical protein
MARLAQNNYYLALNGVDVSPHTGEINLQASSEEIDITSGTGKTHMERSAGLRDTQLSAVLAYDDTALATYVATLRPGQVYTVVFGPEGNTSGKPKHEQSFLLVSNGGPKVDVKKGFTIFELQFSGAAAPVTDFYNGGVF